MDHKLNKRKSATKKRPAAARGAVARTKRDGEAEVALGTLMALLHADRWLFEAAERAKNGQLEGEIEAFNTIRLSIVQSLNRLQPLAYGAMTRGSFFNGE